MSCSMNRLIVGCMKCKVHEKTKQVCLITQKEMVRSKKVTKFGAVVA